MASPKSPAPAKSRKRTERRPSDEVQRGGTENDLADRVTRRWREAAARLRLSAVATDVGELLLKAELDPETRARVMPGEPSSIAVRRGGLLRASQAPEPAAAGLVELERRGVVVQVSVGEWMSAEVALDARVRAACLCGAPSVEASPVAIERSAFPTRVRDELLRAIAAVKAQPTRYVVVLRGRPGTARGTGASMICAYVGTAACRRTPDELRGASDLLEPELSGAAAIWDAAGLDPSPEDLRRAAAWLARSPTAALAIIDPHHDAPDVPGRDVIVIEPEPADVVEREEMWRRALGAELDAGGRASARLARRNRAATGLASRAIRALGLQPGEGETVVANVERQLAAFSRPSALRGIVVEHPAVPRSRLIVQPVVAAGVGRVIALASAAPEDSDRRGVKAMFAGASGTGKTLAARAIATELQLPLFRVDLATVVSKWVGETEKNLRQAMDAAQSAGALLLFDEGDALFAKRGEVQRGTDRYANMEASYLLQAFEAHDGVVIVTTNLMQNIDTAFVRRFDVCVHFQRPTPALRTELWRHELGAAVGDIAEQFIARTLSAADIPGGNIAGAARLARALAAHRGSSTVTEEDLKTAVGSEFEKMGATVEAQRWYSPDKADARPTERMSRTGQNRGEA